MARENTSQLLDQLDELKNHFAAGVAGRLEKLLGQFSSKRLSDTDSLFRYHEILLFLRAYPQSAALVSKTEKELGEFLNRVEALRVREVDLSPLQHPEVSGIAGTSVTDTFSFYIVRWLLQRHAATVAIDWDWFEDENRLADTWPRFMPLLEEDAFVEANVPYREWLAAARNRQAELPWLFARFQSLDRSEPEQAELYNSQKLYVSWTPRFNATRTGMRLRTNKLFYHRSPLIQRRDIDLKQELIKPCRFEKLSSRQGERALDMARAASTARYRELYGFTHGDPRYVYHTELGRGVEVFLVGLPAAKRLPLRAYHAAMIYKNGVPIGYFEGLSLCERMESGFNLYYTFRDGETAWLYARTLNLMRHFGGVTSFTLDPYQIGFENEEGIESGAFWFYRKLGFRPTQSTALQLAVNEEQKLATRKGYRTPATTLRKLARSPMILETGSQRHGDWDRFQVRAIGLKLQQLMARKFGGNAARMRHDAGPDDLALLTLLIPELELWSPAEKRQLERIMRAKEGAEEVKYLKLTQRHVRLRQAIISLGSG